MIKFFNNELQFTNMRRLFCTLSSDPKRVYFVKKGISSEGEVTDTKPNYVRHVQHLLSLRRTVGSELPEDPYEKLDIEQKIHRRTIESIKNKKLEEETANEPFKTVMTSYGPVTVPSDPKLAASTMENIFYNSDPDTIREKILVRNLLRDTKTPRHQVFIRFLQWKGYAEESRIEEERIKERILSEGGVEANRLREKLRKEELKKKLAERTAFVEAENKKNSQLFKPIESVQKESEDSCIKRAALRFFPGKIESLLMKKGKRYKTQSILRESDKMISHGFYKANPSLYTEISLRKFLPLMMSEQVSTSRVKKKVAIKNLSEDQSMAKVSRWLLENAEKVGNRGIPDKRAALLAQEIVASRHDRNASLKKKRDALYAEVWPQLDWTASDIDVSENNNTTSTKTK